MINNSYLNTFMYGPKWRTHQIRTHTSHLRLNRIGLNKVHKQTSCVLSNSGRNEKMKREDNSLWEDLRVTLLTLGFACHNSLASNWWKNKNPQHLSFYDQYNKGFLTPVELKTQKLWNLSGLEVDQWKECPWKLRVGRITKHVWIWTPWID